MRWIARGIAAALLIAGTAPAASAQGQGEAGSDTAIDWVSVPGGTFAMGSGANAERDDEKPAHEVRVGDFTIARTEVTQRLWQAVMGSNPSSFAGCDDCPVENVSWEDVQAFLAKYREKTGVALRLPTEAEWEYAAGGGAAHQKWAGTDAVGALPDFAWYERNAEKKTHPVGQKKPNGLGLHDMSGNVGEWVADFYAADYYKSSPKENPAGPEAGDRRVARGGSWWYTHSGNRTAYRMRFPPTETSWMVGFRPVRQ